jgi:hypothetical protein
LDHIDMSFPTSSEKDADEEMEEDASKCIEVCSRISSEEDDNEEEEDASMHIEDSTTFSESLGSSELFPGVDNCKSQYCLAKTSCEEK